MEDFGHLSQSWNMRERSDTIRLSKILYLRTGNVNERFNYSVDSSFQG